MKFNLTVIALFFLGFISSAQQIGDGYAPSAITDFSAPLKSGIYNGLNGVTAGMAPDGSHLWQHLIVARHPNTTYNFQLQINSSFTDNDRLFFRKIATSPNASWIELATRGANTFIGNQNITGTLSIDAYQSTSLFSVGKNHGVKLSIGNSAWNNTSIIETGWTEQNGDFTDIKVPGSGSNTAIIRILKSGHVGIGTNTPSNIQGWNKVLDVAGLGHSKILATTDNSLFRVGLYSHSTWLGGGGFIGTESNHALHFVTNYIPKMSILTNGNVGIGIFNPSNKLDVNGTIHSKEVKVDMNGWSDFVFKKEYNLPTLEEVEKHIAQKGHLENIPSEDEVLKNGINLGEMNAKLLQKIEELTLYIIEQDKKTEQLKTIILDQNKRLEKLENKQ